MKKLLGLASVFLLLLAACNGGETPMATAVPTNPPPTATPAVEEATVVDVINQVDAHPQPAGEWEPAAVDMAIYQGGQVRAAEASTARLAVGEGLVRVAPNTIFTLGRPEPETLQMNLEEGQVWIEIEGLAPGEGFRIETSTTVASVRGTRFSVRTTADGSTVVSSQVDTVMVSAAGAEVTVTAGLQTTVPPGMEPTQPISMTVEEQVRWGMAVGAGLDVALPAVSEPLVISYEGYRGNTSWSADGRFFALTYVVSSGADGFRHVFYDVAAGEPISISLPANTGGVFFDPAGEGFAYQTLGLTNGQICTADMSGATQACFGGDGNYGWPYWSPDGEWISAYSSRGLGGAGLNLFLIRRDGSEVRQLTFDTAGFNIRQSWSPDGRQIAYVNAAEYNGVGDLWVVNADGSNPRILLEGVYDYGADHVDWSPDGLALAVPAYGGGLYIVPADGSPTTMVPGTDQMVVYSPRWSPTDDGWPIYFTGYELNGPRMGLWYAQKGQSPELLVAFDTGFAWEPIWSPDGRHVALGFQERTEDLPQVSVYLFSVEPSFWP